MRRGDLILHSLVRHMAEEAETDDMRWASTSVLLHRIYLVCTYVSGQVAPRLLRMPSLEGEIVSGILLGVEEIQRDNARTVRLSSHPRSLCIVGR